MKNPTKFFFLPILLAFLFCSLPFSAANDEVEHIIPLFAGSKVRFDRRIGYEELPIIIDNSSFEIFWGTIRRSFLIIPEGRSPLEVIRNYEQAITNSGGHIIFKSRAAQEINIEGHEFKDLFTMTRLGQNDYAYWRFPENAKEYLAGKIKMASTDVYVVVAAGYCDNRNIYELITLIDEPMEIVFDTFIDSP